MTPPPCFKYDTLVSNFLGESIKAVCGKMGRVAPQFAAETKKINLSKMFIMFGQMALIYLKSFKNRCEA